MQYNIFNLLHTLYIHSQITLDIRRNQKNSAENLSPRDLVSMERNRLAWRGMVAVTWMVISSPSVRTRKLILGEELKRSFKRIQI